MNLPFAYCMSCFCFNAYCMPCFCFNDIFYLFGFYLAALKVMGNSTQGIVVTQYCRFWAFLDVCFILCLFIFQKLSGFSGFQPYFVYNS